MFRKFIVLVVSIIISLTAVGCTNVTDKNDETVFKNDKDKYQALNWKESSLFKSGGYTMIGEEGRLGFIYDDNVTRFYPNKENKYMWHFWGDAQEFDGELKVIANHNKSKEQVIVIQGLPLGGTQNGANAHTPSMMSLPKSGMWKLDAYIGDKLFGTVFVKVHKK